MKKLTVTTVLALLLAFPVSAATNDFTADSDITVSAVTFGDTTANMIIMNGSTAASWSFTSASAFTVTDPGTFKVRSDNAAVKSFLVKSGGTTVACALNNATPSASYYVTLPTASGTYTVEPSTATSCTALCTAITGINTYYQSNGTYTIPGCGAATCANPYSLSAASGNTTASCNPPAVAGSPGGGGTPTTPTTPTEPTTPTTPTPTTPTPTPTPLTTEQIRAQQSQQIATDATAVATANVENILANVGATKNTSAETSAASKYTAPLVSGLANISQTTKTAITNFVTYGTLGTLKLGAGERAGVVNSYKSAFSKVPSNGSEWSDVIKIANGRWPNQRSTASENNATTAFEKIYKREPKRTNSNDDAAVTVIAYGLRPSARNTSSEKAAINSFKAIYGYAPKTATAWDIVRAIAYSGAKR